ncbi:hypothetical protein N7532_009472 [Penicillium argentinense]|uniref:Uncharacterized protein n=1 Tax=Penicillium argentinense TaxID=1131581 RepID=A0A9W9EZC6_9EURO|nr:uncharacterized protein N7532_009472 [Penicillium argentinense]KAJ5090788.1 hypothetical protein N7532_009472 [Penicillium argentinense]
MPDNPQPPGSNKGLTSSTLTTIRQKIAPQNELKQKAAWRPGYLKRRVLIAFVVVFAALIAALEALSHVSHVNYGIASSVASRHYAWTYGPTAILTIVTALWARTEFQAKQNAPWQAMQEGPTAASQSVLLDYISIMQPVALYKAFKYRNIIVASAISCTLLLRLAIMFSTGLFSLQDTPVHKNGIEIQLEDAFDGRNADFNKTGGKPFDVLNSVLFRNGTYAEGTTKDLVFQRFSAPNITSDAILTVPVSGITTNLDCQSAELDVILWQYYSGSMGSNMEIDLTAPSCKMSNITFDDTLGSVSDGQNIGDPGRYLSTFKEGQCDGTTGSDGKRIILFAGELEKHLLWNRTIKQEVAPGYTENEHRWKLNYTVPRSTQLICQPTYSFVNLSITTNASESLSNARIERLGFNSSSLPGLGYWDLPEAVLDDDSDSSKYARPIQDHYPYPAQKSTSTVSMRIRMGAWLAGKTGDFTILLQGDNLRDVGNAYYQAEAAQFIKKGIVKENPSMVTGSAIVNENRVVMTQLPLRIMEVCLALGILLAIAMIVKDSLGKSTTAPWNPNSISGVAAIVSASKELAQSLHGTSAVSMEALNRRLGDKRYFSQSTTEGFSIKCSDGAQQSAQSDPEARAEPSKKQDSLSKPMPSFPYRVAIFIAVILLIVALEVVLHVSQSNNGLGNVDTSDEYIHYSWTVVPSVVMVSASLLFGSIDFNTRTLAPYAQLRRPTGTTFGQFMTLDFRNSLDMTIIFTSIRTKHFAVLATTVAAFITSFLTIVTSGLFTPLDVPNHVNATFIREDTFQRFGTAYNYSLPYSEDVQNVVTAQYIIQENNSYPRWTHKDLAFPRLRLSEKMKTDLSNESFVDLWVPATRAALDCRLETGTEVRYELGNTTTGPYGLEIYPPSISCPPYSYSESRTRNYTQDVLWDENGVFGRAHSWQCANPKNSLSRENAFQVTVYYWGYVDVANRKVKHIAAMSCAGAAETVNTWTRFELPNFDIPSDHPPVPDESSATPAPDQFTPYLTFDDAFAVSPSKLASLDAFFSTLTTGRYAIPSENLRNPGDVEKVAKAIKFQSGIIKAQEFNNWTRIANSSLDVSYPGEVFLGNQLRLFQDAASTRVLDALLGVILILGIVGSVLINTDYVLPKDPCSIAAVASLLADSNLLDWYHNGEENPNDSSLGRKFFAGCRFFLGRPSEFAGPDASPQNAKNVDDLTIYVHDHFREGIPARQEVCERSHPDTEREDLSPVSSISS